MKSITVLCRGQSLEYINDLPKSDIVILVNRFGDELESSPALQEYIKDSEIYLCTSGSSGEFDSLFRINFFDIFKPKKLIRPYLTDEDNIRNRMSNSCPLPDTFLSEVHKKWMYERGVDMPPDNKYEFCYPSSGITAVSYAILETNCDIVNIIGLDFYENSQYLTEPCHVKDWGYQGHMQEILLNLVSGHPQKKFNMITTGESYLELVKELPNMNLKKVTIS